MPVSIRYGTEVLGYFKASGAGWPAWMDEALKEYVETLPVWNAKEPWLSRAD
ncbi:BrnA antitoxin family protein [Synechococcus sp. J7-Johnson]|nr:BrnA antitoxin family protein [Synechococcus sp. J7-Johnson]